MSKENARAAPGAGNRIASPPTSPGRSPCQGRRRQRALQTSDRSFSWPPLILDVLLLPLDSPRPRRDFPLPVTAETLCAPQGPPFSLPSKTSGRKRPSREGSERRILAPQGIQARCPLRGIASLRSPWKAFRDTVSDRERRGHGPDVPAGESVPKGLAGCNRRQKFSRKTLITRAVVVLAALAWPGVPHLERAPENEGSVRSAVAI